MAPEQISGAVVTTRADVFTLGVLMFEMVFRRRPFGECLRWSGCGNLLRD